MSTVHEGHKIRNILPELSAQGIRKSPNPCLPKALDYVKKVLDRKEIVIVDQGCGQLRHLEFFLRLTKSVVLVDTALQLAKYHDFYGQKLTISEFVKEYHPNASIQVVCADLFEDSKIAADVIFSINVLDVIPPRTRTSMLRSAYNNLSPNGLFIAIVPTNDSRTLKRCRSAMSYADGHLLHHPSGYTFYKNWNVQSLKQLLKRNGFQILENMSTYRQLLFVCKRQEKD